MLFVVCWLTVTESAAHSLNSCQVIQLIQQAERTNVGGGCFVDAAGGSCVLLLLRQPRRRSVHSYIAMENYCLGD